MRANDDPRTFAAMKEIEWIVSVKLMEMRWMRWMLKCSNVQSWSLSFVCMNIEKLNLVSTHGHDDVNVCFPLRQIRFTS